MGADPEEEVSTTREWREQMVAARKARKMSQAELASRVSTSQNTISSIEQGVTVTSDRIKPIARVLKIGLPRHYIDDDDRAWDEAGMALRKRSLKLLGRALAMVRVIIDTFSGDS